MNNIIMKREENTMENISDRLLEMLTETIDLYGMYSSNAIK